MPGVHIGLQRAFCLRAPLACKAIELFAWSCRQSDKGGACDFTNLDIAKNLNQYLQQCLAQRSTDHFRCSIGSLMGDMRLYTYLFFFCFLLSHLHQTNGAQLRSLTPPKVSEISACGCSVRDSSPCFFLFGLQFCHAAFLF